MTWRRVLFCDECDKPIPLTIWDKERNYSTGYRHMCKLCQKEKLGYLIEEPTHD